MAMTFYDPSRGQAFTTPLPMGEQGLYVFNRFPTLKQNGRGDAIQSQYCNAVWKWRRMYSVDFNWWAFTVLQNGNSLYCNGNTVIPLDNMVFTTSLAQLIVQRPTYGGVNGAALTDVEVRFTHILLS